jgi:DNA-binding response OmpR family regulator
VRVLIVEDEVRLAETIARGLRREGMAIDVAFDGAAALEKIAVNQYDAVVLDRNLPCVHGDDVCRQLAGEAERPGILMLTAAGGVDDRVDGLNLGADDYLPKPFAFVELVARLRALGRRCGRVLPPVLSRGDLELDPVNHSVKRAGRSVELTRKEFAILELLLAADGVVSTEELLERAWDENVNPFTNSVRVAVMTLRRKLGDPQPIETVTGVGYRLNGS